MSFNGPLPRAPQYRPSETSRLNSQRDRASLLHSWKNDRSQAGQIDKLNSQVSQNKRQLARLDRQRATGGMHPFKIYNFPSSLRAFRNDDDWRRFKVRAGRVIFGENETGSGEQFAAGTDVGNYINGNVFGDEVLRWEIPPTDNTQISAAWHEIAVPADGHTYYFWYSSCLGGQSTSGQNSGVMFGKDPANATFLYTGEVFSDLNDNSSWPWDNPYRRWIGSVTIRTDNAIAPLMLANVPYVEQALNSEIRLPSYGTNTGFIPRMAMRGEYDSSLKYYTGDVVTQRQDGGAGVSTTVMSTYVNWPVDPLSTYDPVYGPITSIDPSTHTPDPWFLIGVSHLTAGYHVDGAYQAAKAYLRTA